MFEDCLVIVGGIDANAASAAGGGAGGNAGVPDPVRLLDGVRAPCDPAYPLACVNDASLADYLRTPRGRRWPLLPVISTEHRRKLSIEFAHFLFLVASYARHFMQRVRAFLPLGSCSLLLYTNVNNDKSYAYLLLILEYRKSITVCRRRNWTHSAGSSIVELHVSSSVRN